MTSISYLCTAHRPNRLAHLRSAQAAVELLRVILAQAAIALTVVDPVDLARMTDARETISVGEIGAGKNSSEFWYSPKMKRPTMSMTLWVSSFQMARSMYSFYFTSKIASTSIAKSNGIVIPTALRACLPASPNSSSIRSLAP